MTDLSNRDDLFHAIKRTVNDNPALNALCSDISKAIRKLREYEKQSSEDIPDTLKAVLEELSPSSSDAELRTGARALFVHRLQVGSIKGADLGQFTNMLGLSDDDSDVVVELHDFGSLLEYHTLPGIPEQDCIELRKRIQNLGWEAVIHLGNAIPAPKQPIQASGPVAESA